MTTNSRNRHCLIELIALALVITAGCTRKPKQPASGSPAPQKVVVSHSLTPMVSPLFVAYDKNLFGEQNLDVTSHESVAGRFAFDAVLAGKAGFATVAETPCVHAALQGEKFYILATLASSNSQIHCIARNDHGVSKPEDLKGKKVGVLVGTTNEFYMEQFLKRCGLSRDDVEVANLKPPESAAAFVAGEVDAAFTQQPYILEMKKQLGDRATVFPAGDFYTITFNLICLPEFAEKNPELVTRVLRVVLHGAQFIKDNPDESISLVAKRLKMDPETLRNIWDIYDFEIVLNPSLLKQMREQAEWSIERGLASTDKIPDFRRYVYDKPLRSIKPEAVTIPARLEEQP